VVPALALLIASGLIVLTGCQALSSNNTGSGSSPIVPGSAGLNFGSVAIGSSKTLTDTLANDSSSSVTISTVQGVGSGFTVSGLALPLTLAAGQSISFSVIYQPTAAGDPNVTISFVGTNSQVYASISLTGTSATLGTLSPNPSSVAFSNTLVGSTQNSTVTLTNSGQTDLVINQATLSGAGFAMSNLSLPLTLSAGNSTTITITFAPPAVASYSGNVTFITTSTEIQNTVVLPLSGSGFTAGSLSANPTSLAFGSVVVGSNSSKSVTITNTGGASVNISQITASAGSSVSGLTLPVTVGAGQSAGFNVTFDPTASGAVSGSVSVISTATNSSLSIPWTGTGLAAGSLTANPSSADFGNATIGKSQTIPVMITNTGGESVTVSSIAASGSGFSYTSSSLPLTLSAGQSTSVNAVFTPATTGTFTGNLAITSNASNTTLNVPLSGTGITQGQLTSNPSSFSFGNVQDGTSKSLSGTLTNSGGSSLTISAANANGTGFSLNGLSLPLTLNSGQSTSFTVLFDPSANGAASGSLSITSNGSNPNLSVPLSGTGVTAGTLSASPASLAFSNTQVGNSTNLSETLTNTGGMPVTITQANLTGSMFTISGISLPLTLNSGQSVTFMTTFTPTGAGAASGSLSIVSNASNSPLSIGLSGTGTATGQLAVTPTSLSFGSVTVGSSSSLTGSLTASGASVTVSSASSTNSEFTLSGISLPVTLTAGQSAAFSVTFTPQASGAASASLSFVSNASNSPTTQTMTGTGTAATQHTVDLSWTASTNAVGYNIYRGTVSGGPYTMINSSLDGTTTYTDNTVSSGTTYYYVTTAVDSSNNESGYSNQAQGVIPTP
jgi:hypothetical protein